MTLLQGQKKALSYTLLHVVSLDSFSGHVMTSTSVVSAVRTLAIPWFISKSPTSTFAAINRVSEHHEMTQNAQPEQRIILPVSKQFGGFQKRDTRKLTSVFQGDTS